MLETEFPLVKERIAVGLVGEGSQCLGFDDEISKDHDFEPGFCLFVTEEDYREFGFKLERAYAKLPKTFMGYERPNLSPVGGNRTGVLVIEDFYTRFLGSCVAPESFEQWLLVPSAALRVATSGEVWQDDLGVFSEVRNELKKGYPEDVRLKKLAAHVILMAQSGQYNLERCISRGEMGAAQLCVFEFIRHAISTIYLLNNVYEPFYKWAYRGMRDLPLLSSLEQPLTNLATADNKVLAVEEIANVFADAFRTQGVSNEQGDTLSAHAYAITNHIKDAQIRNLHIMDGID
jgi:hypothetical protein